MYVSYQNLNVTITSFSITRYFVDARGSGGEARGELVLPLGTAGFDTALQSVRRLSPNPSAALIVGQMLFQCLFRDDIRILYERSYAMLGTDEGLRIEIAFDVTAAAVAELPWEYLAAPEIGHLSLGRISIVRYLRLLQEPFPLYVDLPLRVLLTAAQTYPPTTVMSELDAVEQALAHLGTLVEVHKEPHLTPDKLENLLLGEYHIWHFVGHGGVSTDGFGKIILEDSIGDPVALTATKLIPMLGSNKIRLAVIQACQGSMIGAEILHSLGPALVQAGIPTVIAMQFLVAEESARAFATALYGALAAGVLVDGCVSQARLSVLQAVGDNHHDWGIPTVYSRVSDGRLFDIPQLPKPKCPYPGLLPYEQKDEHIFLGRDDDINRMIQHLRHRHLFLVIGVSGSGKSSLINAGFLPRLRQSTLFPDNYWLIRKFSPGDKPLVRLRTALQSDQELVEQTDDVTAIDKTAIEERLSNLGTQVNTRGLLLIIDQFEELFVQSPPEDQRSFISMLNVLRLDDRCTIIVSLRADFFSDLMSSSLWPIDSSERIEITPLKGKVLRGALERPAINAQIWIEPLLLQRLVDDAADEPGALPLIQETMTLLWDRMEHRVLSLALYEPPHSDQRANLGTAMDSIGDNVIKSLEASRKAIAWRMLLRLVQFGIGRNDTRRRQTIKELSSLDDNSADFEATLQHLASNRLIVIQDGVAGRTVELAHEALLSGWAALRRMVSDRRPAEEVRRRNEAKAQEWVRFGRGDAGLLDASQLSEIQDWLKQPDTKELGVSTELVDLVSASRALVKPTWHTRGIVLIIVIVMIIAGFYSLLYYYLQAVLFRDTARLTVWVAVALAGVVPIVVFLLRRRSETYPLRRFSHTIARPAGIGVVTTIAVATGGLWWLFVATILQTEITCANFVGSAAAEPRDSFAVISQEVEPLEAEVFVSALRNSPDNDVIAWVLTLEEEKQCRRYFRYRLVLRKADAASVGETGLFADREDLTSQTAPQTTQVVGMYRCSLFGLLANKVLNEAGYSTVEIQENSKLPGPVACEPYLAYEEGRRRLMDKQYAEAERLLLNAINQYRDYAWAHITLAEVYYNTDRSQEAIAEIRLAMTLVPTPTREMLTQLAIACYRAGDYPCAEAANLDALAQNPNLFLAHNNLGVVYREWDRPAAAQRSFDRAEEILATNENSDQRYALLKNRGILAYYQRDLVVAERLLTEADRLGTSFQEEITYFLARIAEDRSDNFEECRRWIAYDKLEASGLFREKERRLYATQRLESLRCIS